MMCQEIPERVKQAMQRRDFRQLLEASSFGSINERLNKVAFGNARLTGVPDEQKDWEEE